MNKSILKNGVSGSLTERRKADRTKMAALLIKAMVEVGARAEVDLERDREVVVRIDAPGGAHIFVDFDGGSSQLDVHVCTWNAHGAVFLNPDIGEVNTCHYGKATRVCYGFDTLVEQLECDVVRFSNGSGYLSHDDPRVVAMKNSYLEMGWHWPPGVMDSEGK